MGAIGVGWWVAHGGVRGRTSFPLVSGQNSMTKKGYPLPFPLIVEKGRASNKRVNKLEEPGDTKKIVVLTP